MRANAVRVVDIRSRQALFADRSEPSAARPRQRHAAVGKRIADSVISNTLPVECGQQVFPACITVGVRLDDFAVFLHADKVAAGVIAVNIAVCAACLAHKLIARVIGVAVL